MIGETVSHYKIEALLGSGGMGVVYRALDTRLNRPVAIKFIKPELTANPDRVRRFFQEARSAAAVNHPVIAQIYDIGEIDGMTYIVMEFVEGETVHELILKQELDLLGSIEIALQVAEGLGVAHKAKIVHRDIKSDNIMVTRDGYAKILDFGLAKLLDQQIETAEMEAIKDLTQTETLLKTMAGTVVGTAAYMSPEQARGRPVSQASDVFSLGIVIYEMVTGELPFKGNTPIDTMHAIVFDEVEPVTALRKNLPPELQRILSSCLRKNPRTRYPDANHLAEDLRRLKKEIESGVRTTSFHGLKLQGIMDWLKTSLPLGVPSVVFVAGLLILIFLLVFSRINWALLISQSIWVALLGFLIYRRIRNRKARLLKRFVAKVSEVPSVKAIIIKEDRVTVAVEKAQANIYIRVNSLIDQVNKKLYFGKHLTVAVRDDLTGEEFQRLIREPGVAYVHEDIVLEAPRKSG
jgi:serine/threonine protein kinase